MGDFLGELTFVRRFEAQASLSDYAMIPHRRGQGGVAVLPEKQRLWSSASS